MTERINPEQRAQIRKLLTAGHDRETVAALVGVTPAQVSAVRAHISMGSYNRLPIPPGELSQTQTSSTARPETEDTRPHDDSRSAIYLGRNLVTGSEVVWSPFPNGSANPHVLIVGESGSGKTYTAICLTGELARRGIASVILDYGQGFSESSIPPAAWADTDTEWLDLANSGISLNPLTIEAADVRGPTSVAQRVADSFTRVYSRIGVQQHAVLRDAILDVYHDVGIKPDNPNSWKRRAPAFHQIASKLQSYADDTSHPNRRHASTVASHTSTLFIFNVFRSTGQRLAWNDLLSKKITVLGFRGLEASVQRLATEFVLWNLLGHLESVGPKALRAFVVLDEAHRMSFADNSPVEKFLREARKFGVGLMLASQQPEDFNAVAFANTATKIVFQITDERSVVSRNIHRKISNHSFAEVFETITKLPRGCAYVVTRNVGYRVKIASFEERSRRLIPNNTGRNR